MADWDGEQYGLVSDLQRAMAAESLTLLDLAGDERILDIGCGDGFVTAQIAQRAPRGSVVGVDPSPRMIEAASRQYPTVSFQRGDVTSLTFDAEFDVVTSFNALHWVPDQRAAYRSIAAALVPRGRALVTFVCAGTRPSVEDVGMTVAGEKRWATRFEGFVAPYTHPTAEAFADTVAEAGFEVVTQTVVDVSWGFGSREAFARWCSVGFGDWTRRLDADDAAAFIDDLVDRYSGVVGRDGLFAFYQLRAGLRRTQRSAR